MNTPSNLSVVLLAVLALGLTGWSKAESVSDSGKSQSLNVLADLDQDGNGLYDDRERKALLDLFLKECPELQDALNASAAPIAKALTQNPLDFEEGAPAAKDASPREPQTFDANGDGKVTLQEENEGRHPLQFLVPNRIVKSNNKIPWAIDLFAEWISSAYFQEDVVPGPVAEHPTRGTIERKAAQLDQALQPKKSKMRGGVEFAADSGQHLSVPGYGSARWDYRWCIFTFRIDAGSGTDKQTVLLDINQGNSPNTSSPKIWFNKDTGLHIQYLGQNKGGVDKRIMTAMNVVADGKAWNVVVCGIRYGQMFASVNGVPLSTETKQPPRFSGDWIRDTTSFIGDKSTGNMAWAYDSLIFGLTEPSEAMVRKMSGWAAHRLGFQDNLSADHPYKKQRPVLDKEDFPDRYFHDDKKWNAWGLTIKSKNVTRVNAGGPRVEPKGFERVFYDDFRADRVNLGTSGESDLWGGPGFNSAVANHPPGKEPNTYTYDAENQKQILSLVKHKDRWLGSAFYSVNDLGHGYAWGGPKVFSIRCMFPKVEQKDLPGGLFPAFWSYAPSNLFWRTANRIEVDWFEFIGKDGRWINGFSSHFHYPYLRKGNIFAKNTDSYKRYKAAGIQLSEEKSKIPGGVFIWDGQFHTWEFVVDEDLSYINVTIPDGKGGEKWVEVSRCPTPALYLEPLILILDYKLQQKHGVPKDDSRHDFVVDWIEVLQKTATIEAAPQPPFTARPSLSGSATAGSTITCQPNLGGITDVRYYWFADGYPLTYGPDNTYTLTAAESGKAIRCMVKAVGAGDMPEAWSNILK